MVLIPKQGTARTIEKMIDKITKSTTIPVGLVVTILLVVATSAWSFSARLSKIEFAISDLQEHLSRLEESVARGIDDRWRKADMLRWVNILKTLNPEMKVPPID